MTVTIPTSEAQYGYVVGRVIRALGDTADPDDKPDAVAATGKVTFTPKATLGRTTDYSAFIVREKLDAPLDAQGNLVRYEGATPAGISLTVGAYRVEFTLTSGSIPGFDIEVTAAHTQAAPLDLVTAAPYVPPTGVTVQTMLVPADAVVGQVLAWSASGLDWVDMAAAAGGVSSVAGRTGAVVLSSADLTDAASLATDAELASGLAGKANTSHTHAIANVTGLQAALDGKQPAGSYAASAHTHAPADITGTAVITTDPRLSDARTPTAHTHPASAISDSTATGRSVLTAADAAAARTALGIPSDAPTAYELRGTGIPNGIVTASPGTYYTDTAGTNGAWRWLKKSGTGNTGWECIVGDTGWRNISPWITSNFVPVASGAKVRRILETVYLDFEVAPAESLHGVQTSIWKDFWKDPPSGFMWPPALIIDEVSDYTVWLDTLIRLQMRVASGWISIFGSFPSTTFSSSTRFRGRISWRTDNSWPTTLPGTPA